MTVKELRAEAKAAGIKGFSRMTKEELQAALGKAESLPLLEPQQPETPLNAILFPTPQAFGELLGVHDKGTARRMRKEMRAAGHAHLAGAKRIVSPSHAKAA